MADRHDRFPEIEGGDGRLTLDRRRLLGWLFGVFATGSIAQACDGSNPAVSSSRPPKFVDQHLVDQHLVDQHGVDQHDVDLDHLGAVDDPGRSARAGGRLHHDDHHKHQL